MMRRFATHAYEGFFSGVGSPMAVLVLKAMGTVTIMAIILRMLSLG